MAQELTDIPDEPAGIAVEEPVLAGYLAEFTDVSSVFSAAKAVRDAGYSRWDVHSPFPIHGIDEAIGIRPTVLPWLVLCGGLFGLGIGLATQWFTNAHDYKFIISGMPFFSLPAFIPVIFAMTVLCSALTAIFGMLLLNRLPMLYNPLFKSARFRRATTDRFFVVIDASDPKFNEILTADLLRSLSAVAVEPFED